MDTQFNTLLKSRNRRRRSERNWRRAHTGMKLLLNLKCATFYCRNKVSCGIKDLYWTNEIYHSMTWSCNSDTTMRTQGKVTSLNSGSRRIYSLLICRCSVGIERFVHAASSIVTFAACSFVWSAARSCIWFRWDSATRITFAMHVYLPTN